MYHLVNNLTNKSGDALVGYFVKLKDADGNYATLYSDTNETPIATVSGVANAGITDSTGMYDIYVADGTYDIEFFDKNDITQLVTRIPAVPMFSNTSVEAATEATLAELGSTDTGKGASLVSLEDGTDLEAAVAARATTADLASTASGKGAAMVGFLRAEAGAASRNVYEKLTSDYAISLLDFANVDPTGVTDSTAGIEAAFAAGVLRGKPVIAPGGVYKVDRCEFPNADGFTFGGEGENRTIFVAGAQNQPCFRKEQTAGVVEHGRLFGFSLKAHALGSTGAALDCSGFRNMEFFGISGLSNGALGFYSLFDVSAYPYLTYGCVWDKCGLAEQGGFSKVWDFNNRGTLNPGNNANACTIRDPWIYANSGISIAIDLARSTLVTVSGGLIEGNASGTGVRKGAASHLEKIWFEANLIDVAYANLADIVANNGSVEKCVFSDAHNVDLQGVVGNVWRANSEFGTQTFINNNGLNFKLPQLSAWPAAPTLTRTDGVAGDPDPITSTPVSLDVLGRATFHLRYQVTPGAAGYQEITMALPAGYAVESVFAGAVRGANGFPVAASLGLSSAGTVFVLGYAAADLHELIVRVTIRPIG